MEIMKRVAMLMLTCIISLSVFNHCSKDSKGAVKPVQQEIIVPDENKKAAVEFTLIDRVRADGIAYPRVTVSPVLGRVYVYGGALEESRSILVKTYDLTLGPVSQKLFPIGDGPGDLGLVNVITPVGDQLFITENSNSRVSTYDKDLLYMDSKKVPIEKGIPFGLINDGRHYIGVNPTTQNKYKVTILSLVSFPGFKNKVFWEKSVIHPKFNNGISVIDHLAHFSYFCKDQTIYFLDMHEYRLFTLNLEGEPVRDVIVKVDQIKTRRDKIKEYLVEQGYAGESVYRYTFSDTVLPASWMIPLGKGFVVLRRQDYSSECSGYVQSDYFTYRIEYIGKVNYPCFHRMYSLSSYMQTGMRNSVYDSGYLYLVNEVNEEVWLEKWSVKE